MSHPATSSPLIGDSALDRLNQRFMPMTPEERICALYELYASDKVLLTSSFGTSAAILLHMFTHLNPTQRIHFIDTTYHFAATLAYRAQLTELLGLQVVEVLPEEWKNTFTREDETWAKDPDLCCSINKVEPLDAIKPGFEVWVSGLMGFQNPQRQRRLVFERSGHLLKFHPLIDLTKEQMDAYFREHGLPQHPLQAEGYESIGCTHCTTKGQGRSGRWTGKGKTECGLHS